MKLTTLLMIPGLLISGMAAAFTPTGPVPNVSTIQDYEIPSGAPKDVYLWYEDYAGKAGYNISYGSYDCSYPDNNQSCTHQSRGSTIKLLLTEKRGGMTYPITFQAYLDPLYYDSAHPENSVTCANQRPLNNQQAWGCGNSITTNSRALTLWLPQSEMNALPVGGVWYGTLKLKFHDPVGGNVINYQASITLKGKAVGKQDIYFPEFNGANPLVQLDLHPTGSITGNGFVEDTTTLDMCLYDGYNSNSDSMTLSFKDEGKTAASRKNGYFSIYNTATGGTGEAERIDYRVEMFDPHSKGWMTVKNNETNTLSAGENGQDQIRPVRLPSITYPVLCAPAPLRLIVEKFRVTDKAAGYYKGILSVEFSPSLNSI